MALSPDPRFIAFTVFEDYFVNKMTGEPLDAGVVTFYQDNNRTVKKDVYQLTGSAPNYSFSVLPNPCILSAVGTFQDGTGNNIVPYFFPFDGTPGNSNGNVELYYITVTSKAPGLVPQFDRQAQPPNVTAGGRIATGDERNFISNGQFLVHNDIVSSTNPPITTVDGVDIQPIAEGGWFFKRSNGGTSVFNNSFEPLISPTSGANDFPEYAFNFVCQSFNASDEIRDLTYVWQGVYTFSAGNPPGSTPYTFGCQAVSNDSNIYTFQIILTQNFGSDSPTSPVETVLGSISVTDQFTYFNKQNIVFPDTPGTLGSMADDYVSISLRGPTSSWTAQFRCFILVIGTRVFVFYPPTPTYEVVANSVFGALPVPAPDGSDLYLKVQYTPTGMQFDRSEIGEVRALLTSSNFSGSFSTITNEVLGDGSAFVTSSYSPLGIPMSRLQAVLWNSTYNLPAAGTGTNYATAYIPEGINTLFRLSTNKSGAQTAVAEGSSPTGFTFTTLLTGSAGFAVTAFMDNATAGNVFVYGTNIGAVTAATAGNSGFTVTQLVNNASSHQTFYVTVNALPTASHYFTFSNTTTNYYVWFTVDGSGSDPAPGGTGILVPLLSSYSVNDVAALIIAGMNAVQASNVATVDGASITGGAFFTYAANSVNYTVWYKVAGSGSAPVTANTLIEVILDGTETDDEVAAATQMAINMYSFAVPNFQGVTLKGATFNTSTTLDSYLANRYTILSNPYLLQAYGLNTYQPQNIQALTYNESDSPAVDGGVDGSPNFLFSGGEGSTQPHFCQINTTSVDIEGTSGPQTSVLNYAVNFVIKY